MHQSTVRWATGSARPSEPNAEALAHSLLPDVGVDVGGDELLFLSAERRVGEVRIDVIEN